MPRRGTNAAHVPTADTRNKIKAMVAIGIEHENIAKVMDISPKTLRKHYRAELDLGMIEANAAVGGAMFRAATTKGPGQVTAGIWWTKTRMGWSETTKHELSGPNGEPLKEVRRIETVVIRRGEKADTESTGTKADRPKNARKAARPIHSKDGDD